MSQKHITINTAHNPQAYLLLFSRPAVTCQGCAHAGQLTPPWAHEQESSLARVVETIIGTVGTVVETVVETVANL